VTQAALHPSDLEPSLVAGQTYATRRLRLRIDAAAIVSVLIALLYVLPTALIVPQLTVAGRPALLLSMGLFAWWLLVRLNPWLVMVGPQPLRWAALFYLLSILLSYIAGLVRGLPSLEANRQNFTVLMTFEFLGLMLMAADGIPNWARLYGVLRVYAWSAGFMAFVGLVQSVFEYDIARLIAIPGLQWNYELIGFEQRGGGAQFFRVAGTATHYIEFSTVMAMAVPFAIHFARFAPTRNGRLLYAGLALLVAGVIPMTISRTGVVALLSAFGVMFAIAWRWRTRYNILGVGIGLVACLMVVKPGLLGTIKSLFLGAPNDPSIQGRTDDYTYVARWFAQRPWLGRGPGTLIPDLYLVLDNQWLLTLVTGGLVGVAALVVLHLTCISLATIALRRSVRAADRDLCAALISTQIVAMVVAATFDSFAFTTFLFTLGLMSGLTGAVWRFTHPARTIRTATPRRFFRVRSGEPLTETGHKP
jgi:hypothetical protein